MMFFLSSSVLFGQSGYELENQVIQLNLAIRNEQFVLDSLNRVVEKTAADIANEKSRTNADQNKIVKWMAHAVVVSNHIKESQKRLSVLQSSAEECRQRLEQIYAHTIDSLKSLERLKSFAGDRRVLQNEILFWTEKRVLLSPVVSMLTFDPRKVQEIHLENTSNSMERSVAEDYLRKALLEIDTHLNRVISERKEYEEITDLRKRTAEFVSEVYDQSRITAISRAQAGVASSGSPLTPSDYKALQFRSVVGLIQQLNASTPLSSANVIYPESKSGITQEEYIQLLKQAEKQLKTYKDIVQKKLK